MDPKLLSEKIDEIRLCERINIIKKRAVSLKNKDILQHIFSLLDLTRLNTTDTEEKIKILTQKVNDINTRFTHLRNVSAICIFPVFISTVKKYLTDPNVKVASVAGSFPTSQTFTDIKLKEVEKVIKEGADEIDIVIPLGKFLAGDYKFVSREINLIKNKCGDKILKVILETGEMPGLEYVRHASFLAMEAGADFIKTSTGKTGTGASPESFYVMCEAVKEYHNLTGKKIGIKPAGGIHDTSSAMVYYLIVSDVLGNEWLNSKLLRFGASKLADALLGEKYFN